MAAAIAILERVIPFLPKNVSIKAITRFPIIAYLFNSNLALNQSY
jgi:hypothetical protein